MGIVQCCNIVPSFVSSIEKVEIRAFISPRNFPAVLIIFTGRGGAGNPPLPTARGGAGNPPFPAGRVPRGTGRPSLLGTLKVAVFKGALFHLHCWPYIKSPPLFHCIPNNVPVDAERMDKDKRRFILCPSFNPESTKIFIMKI